MKVTQVSFDTMTGINLRLITFKDFEKKIFVVGRERKLRQLKNETNDHFISGHLKNIEELTDMKYDTSEIGSKKRHFPASDEDLKRDLKVWHLIKDEKAVISNDIGELITKAIEEY